MTSFDLWINDGWGNWIVIIIYSDNVEGCSATAFSLDEVIFGSRIFEWVVNFDSVNFCWPVLIMGGLLNGYIKDKWILIKWTIVAAIFMASIFWGFGFFLGLATITAADSNVLNWSGSQFYLRTSMFIIYVLMVLLLGIVFFQPFNHR